MASFVVDASATLPWCFADEATSWTEGLLDHLQAGDTVVVPAHWAIEVSNGLLVAQRRKRIPPQRPEQFWDRLSLFPIAVEPPLNPNQAKAVLALCDQHNLTVYDAAYLELAKRRAIPLATLDAALQRAAPLENVALIG